MKLGPTTFAISFGRFQKSFMIHINNLLSIAQNEWKL
jgi:hypothetical protein